MSTDGPTITSLEMEDRRFPPPPDFARDAVATPDLFDRAAADPEAFWLEQAKEMLDWTSEPTVACDSSNPPFFTWFADGTLNASVNCLDRHLAERGDRVAFHWEGEPGDRLAITYADLHERVCRLANGLRARGVGKGDRVAIYMGMIPEIVVAMLACARIGAPHTVIFGGFSPDSVRDRVLDCGVTAVITGDGAWRGGKLIPLKDNVDAALEGAPDVHTCIVVRRTENETGWIEGRDVWYHELVAEQSTECAPEIVGAEHPLYILYTSGSTGKPKGILHTTGGYLTGVSATHRWVFDIKDDDVYWCAADAGWVTGHSYIVYGPLANGATSVLYEGAPGTPDKDRWWEIIARYGVTILYCAPTAIRTFMKWGVEYPERHDLSSLRLLGSVGEPINPEAWIWYRDTIGGGACPVVDTWWQTETGNIMIAPLPGISTLKPGSASRPLPGITADVVNDAGASVPLGQGGYLVLTKPWPGMLRTLYGDDDRFVFNLLEHLRGALPGRRRRAARRRRRLLAAGPHRRRDERLGPPPVDDRDRERAGGPPQGGRGRGRGAGRRDDRPGHRGLRDREGGRRRRRGADRRTAPARGHEDRGDRPPQVHRPHRRPPQDALGEDHAPPVARHLREPEARGRHDARERRGRQRDLRDGGVGARERQRGLGVSS